MAITDFISESIITRIDELLEIIEKQNQRMYIFRGVGDSTYELVPKSL